MEEHQVERETFGSPDRTIGPETNVAVAVVTQQRELRGLGAIGRLVRRARLAPRERGDIVEVEGDRGVRARQECDREEPRAARRAKNVETMTRSLPNRCVLAAT